jgi:hypothetical protein
MKRAAAVVVIIAAAFLGYRYYTRSYGPEARYKQFAEEMVKRNYEAAASMTEGLTAKDLAKLGSQEQVGAGPAMFQTLFPSRFEIQSKESGNDGTVTLHAVQTVLFNPPGVESAVRPAMYAKLNQVVGMRKSGDGWKVTSFDNKFEKMDSLSSR